MKAILYLFFFTIFLVPHARSEAFLIEAFDVKVQVAQEGYFDVTETIYVRFTEQRRGIFRTLPLKVRVDGETFRMRYSEIEVPDWNFTSHDESDLLQIRIGDPEVYVTGRQRYQIRYRVTGAFVWLDDHTEFYWNMVGTEWPVPINMVSYSVEFPQDVYFSSEDYGVATGAAGSRASNATIERDGQVLSGITTQSLGPGEGLSVAVRLPANAIAMPEGFRKKYDPARDYVAIVPAMLAAFVLGFWRRFGRNPRDPDDDIPDEYYPPDGLSAAEVGTFIDNKANNRDVIALIPEWGQRGLIRVRSLDPFDDKPEMYLEKVRDIETGSPEYEVRLFQGLFAKADEVLVSDLSRKFYTTMSRVRKDLRREVMHDRLYDKQSYQIFHQGLFVLLFLAGLIGGIVVIATTGWILTGVLLILLGIAALVIHCMPPKHTPEGLALKRRLRGLRNFLRDTPETEIDTLLEKDPDYFGKMLPYAIAFGLDSSWIKLFEQRQMEAPAWWYYGDTAHHHYNRAPISTFSKGFDIQTVSSAFTSVPQSSGSSGSSGGFSGSSGGGFGGGGGGSW